MKLIPDPAARARLHDTIDNAHDRALEATRDEAIANAPRQSGEYAASLQTHRNGEHGAVYSNLPQAGAVERGANVGDRRGPHMAGAHSVRDAGRHFPQHMTEALRGAH